jgi:DNA repair exonuclease SbcCD ATPase subunit
MSSLDFDLDTQMNNLEREWRQGYEASIAARAEFQALAADRKTRAAALDAARERLDRAEASKARIMAKIERLEETLLQGD